MFYVCRKLSYSTCEQKQNIKTKNWMIKIEECFWQRAKCLKKRLFLFCFFNNYISPSIKLYFIHSCYNVSVVLMWGFIQWLLSLLQPPTTLDLVRVYADHHHQTDEQICQSLCWSPLSNWWTDLSEFMLITIMKLMNRSVRVYVDHHYQTDEQILPECILINIIDLMSKSWQSLCW